MDNLKAYVNTKVTRKDGTSDSYLTRSIPVKITTVPRKGQTLSGYGSRLPTQYTVLFNDRWHRVKCICFSNCGTLYIGKTYNQCLTINIDQE